jgi:hypothetical protein
MKKKMKGEEMIAWEKKRDEKERDESQGWKEKQFKNPRQWR